MSLESFPETSFEDVETTFTPNHLTRSQQSSPENHHIHDILPPSTASSESTTFSNSKEKYSTYTESEGAEEDDELLDDFEEFKDKNDYGDIMRSHFGLNAFNRGTLRGNCRDISTTGFFKQNEEEEEEEDDDDDDGGKEEGDLVGLRKQFESRLSLESKNSARNTALDREVPNLRLNLRPLRKPKSMLQLKRQSRDSSELPSISGNRPKSTGNLPTSKSVTNLRPTKGLQGIRYKKSMPLLSRYNRHDLIPEEDEETDKAYREDSGDEDYENDFEGDFHFNKGLMQPQFLMKEDLDATLKLSPSQYTITRDDTLLTPQLRQREKRWNEAQQLDSFREKGPPRRKKKSKLLFKQGNISAGRRLKTIKQEIDHNTPMKKGNMVYNPQKLTWEGNEKILNKFQDAEIANKKALLITKKRAASVSPFSAGNEKVDTEADTRNRKIVGKMMFDEQNLRWVSIDGNEKDPFDGIQDFVPSKSVVKPLSHGDIKSQRSQSQLITSRDTKDDRLLSSGTTRFHSLGATFTGSDPAFNINSKLLEKFYHEENKWSRKVGGWFILGDKKSGSSHEDDLSEMKNDGYMYEIRNMVISSARS